MTAATAGAVRLRFRAASRTAIRPTTPSRGARRATRPTRAPEAATMPISRAITPATSTTVCPVAAVIAAVAGITAGAVYSESGKAAQAAMWAPIAAVGTVIVQFPLARTGEDAAALVDAATVAVRENLPVTDVQTVYLAVLAAADDGDAGVHDEPGAADGVTEYVSIVAQTAPEQECPLWADDGTMTAAERGAWSS